MAERHPSSQRFHDLLEELGQLHDRKQADYGVEGDPLANVRASEEWGIPGWVGCLVRASDKVRRLQAAAKGSTLQNEGVEDSLKDLAAYALIGLILYQDQDWGDTAPGRELAAVGAESGWDGSGPNPLW